MRFSERIGAKKPRPELQVGSMDNNLRTALWNTTYRGLERILMKEHGKWQATVRLIWQNFLKQPIDNMPEVPIRATSHVKDWFFNAEWHEVYDLVEALAGVLSYVLNPRESDIFKEVCNQALESESSGYRFVGEEIAPITTEVEIGAIEQAMDVAGKHGLAGAREHLRSALEKLSDKKSPDYRNSIKESISAVESLGRVISGKPGASLGEALGPIESKVGLHPSLKRGFSAIYGYTSDEAGIRHAMIDESKCDFDDARYMLVSCSAFVNYLIGKASKAGLLK